MSNTTIQIKRSTTTAVPPSLNNSELAYSFNSDKLFIGNSTNHVIAVGGKYFIDNQNTILTIANLAYDAANNAMAGSMDYAYVNNAIGIANSWANTVVAGANGWANTVAAGANGWANTVGSAANGYASAVGTAANSYSDSVGAASNGWANITMSYANNHSDDVGVAANTYANNTFLKLTGGTINGDLNVSGNLTITGNTSFINVSTYKVDDPLIYLASNNYTSDLVDIGFVANYNNGSCTSVHTGFFRDAGSKEYYVFDSYDKEPDNNIIDPNGNNFTIAVLNAVLKSSNITLNDVNLWSWINNAYTQANVAPDISNSYTVIVGAAANDWSNTVVAGANAWSNTKVSSVSGTVGEIYSSGGTTPTLNLISTAVSAATYGGPTQIPVITVDSFGRLTFASNVSVQGMDYPYVNTATEAANTYALSLATNINGANITSGIVGVPYGGTGNTTFTTNGILYGNGTGSILVTGAGSDGQVLQSVQGIPQFAMLDGGAF